ncbi:hypothetical protein WA026_010934 [Henosepilachna vigintioctopunctata]|uniref:Pyridoxal-dependent decarboxylase domain-containing protein 1 n=1 Tax=Henosepilachna vigintioctopunctata TaxID=420089 RepID=A0AAW1UQI1_9CUCU
MASPPSPKEKILKNLSNALESTKITNMFPEKEQNNVGELAIEASEIVSRLEQIAEGVPIPESAYSQPTVFLGLECKNINEILDIIYGLMSVDEDGEQVQFPPLDTVTKLVIVSHSLAAYCGGLERGILQKLSTRFTTDTTRWLSHMCGFLDSSTFYHEDQLEGLVRVTKMMLHYKYPRYLEDGALALTNSLPTIYSSVSSPLGVVQHLCRQLGLPLACVRPVPNNTLFGSQYTMDVAALQKMLQEDVAVGRTPLIVIADAGTFITGHVDNISRIQELCKAHDVWLHLRGHSLATLFLPNLSNRNNQMQPIADSFTLTFGSWFGIPGLPMVTLYRMKDPSVSHRSRQVGANRESTLPLLAGLNTDHQGRRIISLPLWTCLQRLGQDGVQLRIRDNFIASEHLWMALNVFRNIRILSPRPGGDGGNYTISELLARPTSISVLLESTASCVVFQFTPEWSEGEIITKVPPYYDKLNSWLGQILHQDAPQIPLDICELENVGVVLRFCPLESSTGKQPTEEEISSFVQCLEQQLVILKATIQHKETFIDLVDQSPVLSLVELPEWAGLGGVRYVPEGWEQLLTDQAKNELNNLNIALVEALRTTDSAFSLGEGGDGLMCIRFGMLTPQSDVEELLSMVIKVGQSVEENSKLLDSMAEIVKKGIETATLDLQKENEELLWQDGILRHVPVVGTFVNWWSPKSKETGVKGRSLNLTQGVVESTENIYKYHMQIQTGKGPQGSKSPPTPLIQTPVGASHSRSSSHTSHASSQGIVNHQTVEVEVGEKNIQDNFISDKDNQSPVVNSNNVNVSIVSRTETEE